MKSWGERLIAGFKSWRSNKRDSLVDETCDVEGKSGDSLKHSDAASHAKLSIRFATKRSDETDVKPNEWIEPETPSQASVLVKEPLTLVDPAMQFEPTISATMAGERSAAHASLQKRFRDRKPKISRLVTDSELAELEAENARLKLLLKELLEAKKNNSQN
ncbi:hypothetical protein WKW50_23890 [Ochrobactrum sp. GPK 3]|uniref:hypothetical protein n=1 Tax=Brucella sp. 22210 TaxID=3453892 RepID=UPI0031386053